MSSYTDMERQRDPSVRQKVDVQEALRQPRALARRYELHCLGTGVGFSHVYDGVPSSSYVLLIDGNPALLVGAGGGTVRACMTSIGFLPSVVLIHNNRSHAAAELPVMLAVEASKGRRLAIVAERGVMHRLQSHRLGELLELLGTTEQSLENLAEFVPLDCRQDMAGGDGEDASTIEDPRRLDPDDDPVAAFLSPPPAPSASPSATAERTHRVFFRDFPELGLRIHVVGRAYHSERSFGFVVSELSDDAQRAMDEAGGGDGGSSATDRTPSIYSNAASAADLSTQTPSGWVDRPPTCRPFAIPIVAFGGDSGAMPFDPSTVHKRADPAAVSHFYTRLLQGCPTVVLDSRPGPSTARRGNVTLNDHATFVDIVECFQSASGADGQPIINPEAPASKSANEGPPLATTVLLGQHGMTTTHDEAEMARVEEQLRQQFATDAVSVVPFLARAGSRLALRDPRDFGGSRSDRRPHVSRMQISQRTRSPVAAQLVPTHTSKGTSPSSRAAPEVALSAKSRVLARAASPFAAEELVGRLSAAPQSVAAAPPPDHGSQQRWSQPPKATPFVPPPPPPTALTESFRNKLAALRDGADDSMAQPNRSSASTIRAKTPAKQRPPRRPIAAEAAPLRTFLFNNEDPTAPAVLFMVHKFRNVQQIRDEVVRKLASVKPLGDLFVSCPSPSPSATSGVSDHAVVRRHAINASGSPPFWTSLTRLDQLTADCAIVATKHGGEPFNGANFLRLLRRFLDPASADFRVNGYYSCPSTLLLAAAEGHPTGEYGPQNPSAEIHGFEWESKGRPNAIVRQESAAAFLPPSPWNLRGFGRPDYALFPSVATSSPSANTADLPEGEPLSRMASSVPRSAVAASMSSAAVSPEAAQTTTITATTSRVMPDPFSAAGEIMRRHLRTSASLYDEDEEVEDKICGKTRNDETTSADSASSSQLHSLRSAIENSQIGRRSSTETEWL